MSDLFGNQIIGFPHEAAHLEFGGRMISVQNLLYVFVGLITISPVGKFVFLSI